MIVLRSAYDESVKRSAQNHWADKGAGKWIRWNVHDERFRPTTQAQDDLFIGAESSRRVLRGTTDDFISRRRIAGIHFHVFCVEVTTQHGQGEIDERLGARRGVRFKPVAAQLGERAVASRKKYSIQAMIDDAVDASRRDADAERHDDGKSTRFADRTAVR